MFAKVMFLHLSVHSQGGGLHRGGVHLGGLHPGGWADPPLASMRYGRQAGTMHPTGMHSC